MRPSLKRGLGGCASPRKTPLSSSWHTAYLLFFVLLSPSVSIQGTHIYIYFRTLSPYTFFFCMSSVRRLYVTVAQPFSVAHVFFFLSPRATNIFILFCTRDNYPAGSLRLRRPENTLCLPETWQCVCTPESSKCFHVKSHYSRVFTQPRARGASPSRQHTTLHRLSYYFLCFPYRDVFANARRSRNFVSPMTYERMWQHRDVYTAESITKKTAKVVF